MNAVENKDTNIEYTKGTFNFRARGIIMKKTNEGIIIKTILFDKSITFCELFVSQ